MKKLPKKDIVANMNTCKRLRKWMLVSLGLLIFSLSGCSIETPTQVENVASINSESIPEYNDVPYITINNNQPSFSKEDISDTSFEYYSDLDELGRCGVAFAIIGEDLMPTKKRGSIGMIKPTGWHTVKYDNVDGKYLYNRCHLIGYQLTGENANEKNLITGTRYMNVEGMLPFENMVADYVKESKNHVLYRVIPIYENDNLLASGVQMEAFSVEDDGAGISFNVFVYNQQPGISINYKNGESNMLDDYQSNNENIEVRGNRRSHVYHLPGQRAYDEMENSNNLVVFDSEEKAIEAGYRKAQQ